MTAIKAIHAGLRQLGIAEDDARDLYERQTGARSLRAMTPRQHDAVLGELRRLGFKPASKGARKRLEGKYAGKLQALWIAGWNLGLVRNRDDAALEAFVKRQTGVDAVRFCHDAADARAAIEALKGWLARDGGVDWTRDSAMVETYRQDDAYRIASAQWLMLTGEPKIASAFWSAVAVIISRTPDPYSPPDREEWIAVMNDFGKRVRARKASRKAAA